MSMIKFDKDGNKVKQNAENKNHYFSTPDHIADIMAQEFLKIYDGTSRILDIGIGKCELTKALIRAGIPKENVVGIDLEDTGECAKLGIEFYCMDFFSLDLNLFKYFIANTPYKNMLHRTMMERCVDFGMKGVFIAPNMPYHNAKCKVSKYISKEIWSDNFRKDFKLPSTQISIFTLLDQECNDGGKLEAAYFGDGYEEWKQNYPKCSNPITKLPKYNGQPNSLVFQPTNVWAAPGVFTGKGAAFLHDAPTKNEKLITYDRGGRFWKEGDPKNYPCIQYRDEAHKQKILDFYRPIFETHRKFIVIHCENFIPCPPEDL